MVGLAGKTESFQLNHILKRSTLPMQTRIARLIFLKIYIINCCENMVRFCQTAKLKMFYKNRLELQIVPQLACLKIF